jgi:hypothetical protein
MLGLRNTLGSRHGNIVHTPDYFRIFQECEAYNATVSLIGALRQRGIKVPILEPSKGRPETPS